MADAVALQVSVSGVLCHWYIVSSPKMYLSIHWQTSSQIANGLEGQRFGSGYQDG